MKVLSWIVIIAALALLLGVIISAVPACGTPDNKGRGQDGKNNGLS
jgi:hypothetical protein